MRCRACPYALSKSLEQLAVFCEAERCSLALTQGDGMRLVLLQSWAAPGVPPGPTDGRNLAAAGLPHLLRGLRGPGLWLAHGVYRAPALLNWAVERRQANRIGLGSD
jgi:hypothetical protein